MQRVVQQPDLDTEDLYQLEKDASEQRDSIICIYHRNAAGHEFLSGSSAGVVSLSLCVEDADACFAKAVMEGAEPLVPVEEVFWGDRWGIVGDPFGHIWAIATHVGSPQTPFLR